MLPQGLGVSGVATWAVRLVNELVSRGRDAALVIHATPAGTRELDLGVAKGVACIDARTLPPIDEANGDLSAFVEFYRDAVDRLGWPAPITLSPNLLGDCYGIAAGLVRDKPDRYRVLAWHHSDIAYNDRVLTHYEPMIHRFVGVSSVIAKRLRRVLPARAHDVRHVPYGVPVVETEPTRAPRDGRPLRLVYTGRIEHEQKRVGALVACSDRLDELGVAHELVLLGDGAAADEIDGLVRTRASVTRVAACAPAEVQRRLDGAGLFVLVSRYEGLCVSMLEALGRGCAPVVTRVESGAFDAIDSGVNGLVVDVDPDANDAEAGAALAETIAGLTPEQIAEMRHAAWASAERYSLRAHADAVCGLIDAAAGDTPRRWPEGRPIAFTARGPGGSGTVPAEGAELLRDLLDSLAGRRIVIHGTGRHTNELAGVFAASGVELVAVADDDRGRHGGECLGAPVIDPRDASDYGATDAVISSWLHQEAVWARRAVYERQGIRVHRIYETTPCH